MCNACKKVRRDFPPSECSCEKCRKMCNRPCWLLPDEAERIEKAIGQGVLMGDYWVRSGGDVQLKSAPLIGCKGESAPFWPTGGCALLKGGKCTIHANKPYEGRAAIHAGKAGLHEAIARAWFIHNGGDARSWRRK